MISVWEILKEIANEKQMDFDCVWEKGFIKTVRIENKITQFVAKSIDENVFEYRVKFLTCDFTYSTMIKKDIDKDQLRVYLSEINKWALKKYKEENRK